MNRVFFAITFVAGLVAVAWVGTGFVGTNALALAMTVVIGGVYGLGAFETWQFRRATSSLAQALDRIPQPLPSVTEWLAGVPSSLQNPVRARIEGDRLALPGLALTPYLVGLLVMLGMLGTFMGMVVTFKGAVFALEGSTDLQAIRSALAAPIKGLGLSFGTSVAGVAASAMLGLMSALSRRERMDVSRQLDHRIATTLRPFSHAQQRDETFRALQAQAQALPDAVERLQRLMEQMDRRNEQLDAQLLSQQQMFHRETSAAYAGLAEVVGASLKDSLATGARLAGESIRPVFEATMTEMAQDSRRLRDHVGNVAQAQVDGLSAQFALTAQTVAERWSAALLQQAATNQHLVEGLNQALAGFSDRFEQRSAQWLAGAGEVASQAQAALAVADSERLRTWTAQLEAATESIRGEWQSAGTRLLAQQQAVCQTLERTAHEVTERATQQTGQTLDRVAQLALRSEELARSRIEAEAGLTLAHRDRMDQLLTVWRTEISALRDAEASRGHAAVERLGELQAALASHLATLGAALEAPISRLVKMSAEVPQAAAEVMVQLKQEMSCIAERDNQALDERSALMAQMQGLMQALERTSVEQRDAVESLVASATGAMADASRGFSQVLDAQAGKASDVAAQVTVSALELSSLGEAFQHGVQLFSESSSKLMESLGHIEDAVTQSMARSDEQVAYYVTQARELIDLSVSSQQGIVEELRRLQGRQPALAGGAAG